MFKLSMFFSLFALVNVVAAAELPMRPSGIERVKEVRPPSLDEEQLSGIYLRGQLGLDYLNSSKGVTGGFGFGYKQDHWRLDVTIDYLQNNASISALTGMINTYYDFGTWSSFTPYLGLGIGMAHLNSSSLYSSQNHLAESLMAGVGYELNKDTALDLGYRLLSFVPTNSSRANAHEVRIGLRKRFD